MINLSMSWCPNTPGRIIRRTHKLLEAAAAADSQADHHNPAGTTAAAVEGSSLDQAVPLMTDTHVNDTGAKKTACKESSTLRGIILLLWLALMVVIFVRHEDNGKGERGVLRFHCERTYKSKIPTVQCHTPCRLGRRFLS